MASSAAAAYSMYIAIMASSTQYLLLVILFAVESLLLLTIVWATIHPNPFGKYVLLLLLIPCVYVLRYLNVMLATAYFILGAVVAVILLTHGEVQVKVASKAQLQKGDVKLKEVISLNK